MMDMRQIMGRTVPGFALGAVLISSAALYAQKVSTDYDHDANFRGYHTFSVVKVQASNPLVEQRLHDALLSQLTAKGLTEVPSGGDVAVDAVGGMHSEQEYNTFYDGLGGGYGFGRFGYRGWGGWGGSGSTTTTVQRIPIGTLRVDMYDGSSHQLVWRGLASDQLSDKPEKNTKKLNKAVEKMFSKYPPKGAQ